MGRNKDVQRVIGWVKERGFRVAPSRSGHNLVLDADGGLIFAFPGTPSDRRWIDNAIGDLKRLGVFEGDPRLAGQVKQVSDKQKYSVGAAPPPLPDIPRKEDQVSTPGWGGLKATEAEAAPTPAPVADENGVYLSGSGQTFILFTQKHQRAAHQLMNDIRDLYNLNTREGRTVAHGAEPVLREIIKAYHETTGEKIPTFNYTKRKMSTNELARLCADRTSSLVRGHKIGETRLSPVSIDSLSYSLAAFAWFEQRNYEFPDGRELNFNKREVSVKYPSAPAPGTIEEQQKAALEVVDGWPPQEFKDITEEQRKAEALADTLAPGAVVEVPVVATPLALRALAQMVLGIPNGFTDTDERVEKAIQIAIEIAALEGGS